jgi:hypothetical protein
MLRRSATVLLFTALVSCRAAPLPPLPEAQSQPADGLQVRLVRLEHSTVAELAPILDVILQPRYRYLRSTTRDGSHPPAQQRVLVHEPTNSLVLVGTEAEGRELLELVARLDVPAEPLTPFDHPPDRGLTLRQQLDHFVTDEGAPGPDAVRRVPVSR